MSYIFIILVLIILAIVTLLFIFYPKYYKLKVNQRFTDGKPIRTIEPVILYAAILLGIIIFIGVSTLSTIKNLNYKVINLSYQVDRMEFDNNRLLEEIWELSDDVEIALYKDAYIQYVEYEVIEEVEDKTDIYSVKLTFALTEKSIDQTITLYVESDDSTQIFDLSNTTVRQSAIIEFELKTDYIIYIEVDDGIDTTVTDIESFNLYQYLVSRFKVYVELDTTGENVATEYYIENNWGNVSEGIPEDGLQINEVSIEIKYDGTTIIEEVYSTPNVRTSNHEMYSRLIQSDVETPFSGSWQVIIIVIDKYGIEYTNIPFQR
ncbi:MAG: hypothetical protein KQ78_02028 [Candidatus Izimaplasma bacterium HR2]|nr:MAG: hypothetical protein KQ78_02028 [Candidatus Izimaplasma bacterium HR2]